MLDINKNSQDNSSLFNSDYITDFEFCQGKDKEYRLKILQQKFYQEKFKEDICLALYNIGTSYEVRKRIYECSRFLNVDEQNTFLANRCKYRLCPVCAWKQSNEQFSHLLKCLSSYSEQKKGYAYIFVTLTIRNVKYKNLKKQIDDLNAGRKKIFQLRKLKRAIVGDVRNLEITYNENTDTWHSHLHIIIAVEREKYFSRPEYYIPFEELREAWKKAMNLDYEPMVNIKLIRSESGADAFNAVLEVSKYSCKLSSIFNIADKQKRIHAIQGVAEAIYNRRLHTYSGCFRKTINEFKKEEEKTNAEDILNTSFYFYDAAQKMYIKYIRWDKLNQKKLDENNKPLKKLIGDLG